MDFIKIMQETAVQSKKIIAIGIANDPEMNSRIYEVSHSIIGQTSLRFVFWGNATAITDMRKNYSSIAHKIEYISLSNPTKEILSLFWAQSSFSTDDGTNISQIDAIIRGGISSSKFLKALHSYTSKPQLSLPDVNKSENLTLYRLALLETANHHQFFFAGVGIDEIGSLESKTTMVQLGVDFFQQMGWTPNIGLLSGGRLSDIGRDAQVDATINQAIALEKHFKRLDSTLSLQHHQILIEDAIRTNCNLIVAPDGISGNLIYRTLIHLGNGRSYGAVYLNALKQHKHVIIDCSRVAPSFEIEGSIYLAAALSESQITSEK
ncbi:MAG: hypothetical protein ACTSYI_01380 [Promethearchaeota archaeon]